MLTIKAMSGGETYAARHLSNNDYYAQGETVVGQWVGRGAKLIGLEGPVDVEDFERIREGIDPATGEFLRQRVSSNRYDADGEQIASARNLYDFTISAPKAISVQAIEDPRLIEAHRAAVSIAVAELEGVAGARVRRGGANETRITSNLVIARYEHDASRELDPQLHTHLVAANLTYDGIEGKWKALQASEIYAQREYLSEVYRNALAREVTALGYQIENRQEHGKDRGFGIAGIQETTLDKFSRRSAQRDAAISEFLDSNGRLPSDKEIAQLVRDSRPEKLIAVTTAQVKERQRARMTPEETKQLRQLRQTALGAAVDKDFLPADPSLQYAADHIFERLSVSKNTDLYTEALCHGRGKIELSALKTALAYQVKTGAMFTDAGEVATKESLARERWMVNAIDAGVAKHERLGRRGEFVASDRLRPEQKAAVLAVLDSRDFAVNLRGAAGTGKTATLQELRRGLSEEHVNVVAVAPTSTAVKALQQVGFQDATTISRLLSFGTLAPKDVLIVDEAGMVASQDMYRLIDAAQKAGARIVFSGDTAQIKSVSEGDALRILERESKLHNTALLQVQRQTNAEYKAAVETLRHRPLEGFRKLERMGAVKQVDWKLRGFEAAAAYREAGSVPNAKGKERSVLVVAATHNEIKSVTYAIRQDRKRHGEIADGIPRTHHTPLNWTEAQKRDFRNYKPGQILDFHQDVKGIRKNESIEFVSADQGSITGQRPDGSTVTFATREGKTRQTRSFGVFEASTIEVSAGDKLLLQANRNDKGFRASNGDLVTVASVARGAIALDDGRILPADYKQFNYGYAVTAHRSQGKTVDAEVIVAERMKHDIFYVSATRARESLTVITSDSLTLQESIVESGNRQSATELAQRAARARPRAAFKSEDLYRDYQVQQGSRGGPGKPDRQIHQEVNRGNSSTADFGRRI